jgi:geranylgeranyl pyrophosphate synthase
VKATGGLAYARAKAEEYSATACKTIESLPDSPSKQALLDFSSFVVDREK